MTRAVSFAVGVLALLVVVRGPASAPVLHAQQTEVVVLLKSRPLAYEPAAAGRIAAEQHEFRNELADDIPDATVGWRYRLVANGFSLTLPKDELPRLRALDGVRSVLPTASYGPQADSAPGQIDAPAVWGSTLATAGQGTKIGIIDSGVDPSHPYFDPTGYTMPPGFPKGQKRFTTAKVIVARVFAPRNTKAPSAGLAFSDDDLSHGTHVAGIAAGNADTPGPNGRTLSGVAPRAYIGNYKVFVPTPSGLSPNANSPAIVAAIEAAVADGMDVINFSGGEPEIEPSRDIVALALDAAAAAGVVPVVAAGNDYNDVGAGSVSSPGNSEAAITVGAVDVDGTERTHAEFSGVGPTAISLRLKPDVAAPGVDVVSSVPGGWASSSGTSMAAPYVAGAAALLRQRHPLWTVEEIKSALVQTGVDSVDEEGRPAGPRLQGGGVAALGRADRPLLFAEPTALSFGLLGQGQSAAGTVGLDDAGGGAGTWQVSTDLRKPSGTKLQVPSTVEVPGELDVTVTTTQGAAVAGDLDGYLVLTRGADTRRVPLWGHVTADRLARHTPTLLSTTGIHRSTTVGQAAYVSRYRYPETPRGIGVTTVLRGPERVFVVDIPGRVANFGVVVTRNARGRHVEPRVVAGLDENRLTGYAALPANYNPYLDNFLEPVPAAGALSPLPGEYAIVFDSATRADAGPFTFRYWVNDVTPPTLRLRTRTVAAGRALQVAATDAGSGVDGDAIYAVVDGGEFAKTTFAHGVVSVIAPLDLEPGRHRLRLRVSDYQETKNTENVARILPNTRWLTATFRVK